MDWTAAGLALAGGSLIGLSAAMLLLFNGRIAGISGVLGGALAPGRGDGWRYTFIGGLLAGGAALVFIYPNAFPSEFPVSMAATAVAGVLVGFGTRLGNGCTSGHGVCGMSRLSVRSFVATGAFMLAGMVVVAVVRHILGGAI